MKDASKLRRSTKQRAEVYNTVMKHFDHPTAEEIYLDISQTDPRMSKGTVYRNLNILSEDEEITHVRVPGSDRFDRRLDNHYHVICSSCGKVIDAPFEYDFNIDSLIQEKTGFDIKRHRLLFEGLCEKCKKENK